MKSLCWGAWGGGRRTPSPRTRNRKLSSTWWRELEKISDDKLFRDGEGHRCCNSGCSLEHFPGIFVHRSQLQSVQRGCLPSETPSLVPGQGNRRQAPGPETPWSQPWGPLVPEQGLGCALLRVTAYCRGPNIVTNCHSLSSYWGQGRMLICQWSNFHEDLALTWLWKTEMNNNKTGQKTKTNKQKNPSSSLITTLYDITGERNRPFRWFHHIWSLHLGSRQVFQDTHSCALTGHSHIWARTCTHKDTVVLPDKEKEIATFHRCFLI